MSEHAEIPRVKMQFGSRRRLLDYAVQQINGVHRRGYPLVGDCDMKVAFGVLHRAEDFHDVR